MALAVLYPVTASADTVFKGPGLSGAAATALVRAFEVADLPGNIAPPFRLQPYVVMIYASAGYFLVDFLSETTAAHKMVVVSATTGKVISQSGGWADYSKEEILLPGLVAGEIISAYELARRYGVEQLESGKFAVYFEPSAGGLSISFPRIEGPRTALAFPGPKPTPEPHCMGICGTGPVYQVNVKDGHVLVEGVISI